MTDKTCMRVALRDLELEVQSFGNPGDGLPLIMLHDSLGSVEHWKKFPSLVAQSTGRQVLIYSRQGSGRSSKFKQKRDEKYLHNEAEDVLPELLKKLDIPKAILFGHSDGASIALIFAAVYPEYCAGVIVSAPHLFVEEITLQGIRNADETDRESIISRMERFHDDARALYSAWRDTWLNPEFKNWNIEDCVARIKCPLLAIQGKQDEYGTARQVERIGELTKNSRIVLLDDCKHATYKDKESEVLSELSNFISMIDPLS